MEYTLKRTNILAAFGAKDAEIEELLNYNENKFTLPLTVNFPLQDEAFVQTWEDYKQATEEKGVFPVLKERLVQFQFPIQKGISETETYRSATRRGIMPNSLTDENELSLEIPDSIELHIHQTAAGKLPVLTIRNRQDFLTVVRAVARRNEPDIIPDAVGAWMISAYNNWDRVVQYKAEWEKHNRDNPFASWQDGFKEMTKNKALYQDRFMILSDGPYSGVSAESLNLSMETWKDYSIIIRREHEATHYFTQRVLGSMQNNMLDELIADYIGIVHAIGEYRADWFLHFIGLENAPHCREDGRMHGYRSTLSDGAFTVLGKLLVEAAKHVEQFDRKCVGTLATVQETAKVILTLSRFTLEELAAESAVARLEATFKDIN